MQDYDDQAGGLLGAAIGFIGAFVEEIGNLFFLAVMKQHHDFVVPSGAYAIAILPPLHINRGNIGKFAGKIFDYLVK